MRHRKAIAWEKNLKKVFDEIDDHLEAKYGSDFPLRSTRPKKGTTSNKEHDGLFRVGAAFSAGFGSELGRGYIVEIRMVTFRRIPAAVRTKIEEDVVTKLNELLPEAFPDKDLEVSRDGPIFKIHGDLSLGQV